MIVLETVAVAFAMFSAIPMPQFVWNGRNMRYALCAFPLVGLVIGGVNILWAQLCSAFLLPPVLRGAVLCLLPVFITGGIHLDGYADTWDARASHSSPERRQEVMKDPHLGAFAAIHIACYLLLGFALWTALKTYYDFIFALSFCLSRALSGLAVASFPMAKNTGLAHTFADAADKKRVSAVLTLLAAALIVVMALCNICGAAMAATALIVFPRYYFLAKNQFGGISGDLAGWFLQTCELSMLAAAVAVQYIF